MSRKELQRLGVLSRVAAQAWRLIEASEWMVRVSFCPNARARARGTLESGAPSREGKAPVRKVDVVSFRKVGEQFLDWADGEHRDHAATANRLRVSFASLFTFFDQTPVWIAPG